MAGAEKTLRFFYMYGRYRKPKWERKFDIYDALYKIDPSIHVNYLLRKLSTAWKDTVVDDTRYITELLSLKEAGFIILRVTVTDTNKDHHVGKSLRDAVSGTLLLQETFGQGKQGYSADYSIHLGENKEALAKNIQRILDIERTKEI